MSPDPQTVASASLRRCMDIEKALQWAITEMLSAGELDEGDDDRPRGSGWSSTWRALIEGTRGSAYASSGSGPVRASDDARAIVAAVHSLASAGIAWADANLCDLAHFRLDERPALESSALRLVSLLKVHAMQGTRPDAEDVPRPIAVPSSDKNPRPSVRRIVAERQVGRGGRVTMIRKEVACEGKQPGAYCPITYWPTPGTVLLYRADYVAWRAGLEEVRNRLEGRLQSIDLTNELPPAAPWEEIRRIIPNLVTTEIPALPPVRRPYAAAPGRRTAAAQSGRPVRDVPAEYRARAVEYRPEYGGRGGLSRAG